MVYISLVAPFWVGMPPYVALQTPLAWRAYYKLRGPTLNLL